MRFQANNQSREMFPAWPQYAIIRTSEDGMEVRNELCNVTEPNYCNTSHIGSKVQTDGRNDICLGKAADLPLFFRTRLATTPCFSLCDEM